MPLSAFLSKWKRSKRPASKQTAPRRFLAETLEDRILYSATPTVTVAAPAQVKIGETAQIAVTFSNTGTTTGFGPIVAVALPVTGGDGTATGVTPAVTADGLTLASAPTYLGQAVNYQILTLNDAANNGKGVLDPYSKDASGNPIYISTTDPTSPYYSLLNGNYKNGDQIMLIQLPFGSFTPGQPSAEIDFSVSLSNLANVGQALQIKALGEFQYGNDALDNPTTDPSLIGAVTGASTTAVDSTLATLTTSYLGPENETATGPDFPETFQLTLDIANGQTLSGINIYDTLGVNAQFVSVTGVTDSSGAALAYTLGETPSTTTPGGTVEVSLTNAVTGTTATDDVTVDIKFYVPRLDANGNAVLDPNTGLGTTINGALTSTVTTQAYGDALWTPPAGAAHGAVEIGINTTVTSNVDPAALVPLSNTTNPGYYAITAKSIAVQESFVDVTQGDSTDPATMLPGDDIQISLAFQVSDYFAFDAVVLTDTLSDGLHFYAYDSANPAGGMTPTLQLNGNQYVLGISSMNSSNYTVDTSQIGVTNGTGETLLTFDISNELTTRGESAMLLGGGVDPNNPTGSIPNALTNYNDGGTTGTIVFRAQVQDSYSDLPSGASTDAPLDPGDTISATPLIQGSVLTLAVGFTPTGGTPTDNSQGNYSITPDTVTNTVYAINGDTDLADFEDSDGNLNITAGDVVTYRIVYTLPTGDVEGLSFSDFIPEPIYDATEVTGFDVNVSGSNISATGTHLVNGIPDAGWATYGPTSTIQDATTSPYASVAVTSSASDNSLTFTLGTADNSSNNPLLIDILFSVTATNSPFADGLYLTNLVQSSEHGTLTPAKTSVSNALVQVVIDEPELDIYKGVVASTQDGTVGTVGGLTFDDIDSGDNSFSGDLSTEADAEAIGDLELTSGTLPDAGDTVRFALVIQNTGHGEAFQVSFTDTVTSSYVGSYADAAAFVTATNFRLYSGNGTQLVLNADYTLAWSASAKAFTVTLLDQAPSPGLANGVGSIGQGTDANGTAVTNGSNSIVALYDLAVATGAQASSVVTNTATLTAYANIYAAGSTSTIATNTALNFVPNGLSATAIVDISSPAFTEVLTGTQFTGTGNDAADQAVIGEEATYTLTVTVPEGTTAGAALTDTLASGLAFVAVDSVTYSSGLSSANTIGTGTAPANLTVGNTGGGSGNLLTFNFGNITNTNTDNAVAETITIVYRAVVVDTNAAVTGFPTGNQAGTTLANSSSFTYTATPDPTGTAVSKSIAATAAVVNVVEPALTVTDQLSTDNVTYASSLAAEQAGNTVYYKITISNAAGGPTAYDVAFEDALPAELDGAAIVSATINGVTSSNFQIVGDTLSAITTLNIAAGTTVSIVVQGTLDYSVHPADVITNTSTVTWTSVSGSPGVLSSYNSASTERTGAGGVGADGTVLNNYAAAAATTLTIDDETPVKTIVSTSEAVTTQASSTDADLTIGEIVRYQLVWEVPQGTAAGLSFTDVLPSGLEYLADGTADVALVSNGGQTSGLTASAITAAAAYITGSSSAVTPVSGITATVSGQTVTFNFGTVTNHDDDTNAEYIVVQFNALVTNSAADHAGVTLSNSFSVAQTGAATSALGVSNLVTSAIVEPSLTVDKEVTNGPADAGNTIDYQVVLTNEASATGETGFNIDLTDTLPIFLTGLSGFTVTTTGTVTGLVSTSNSTSFTVTSTSMSQGATIVVTYTAQLSTSVPADQNITNTATATWENLANGAGTPVSTVGAPTANTTGSALAGALGTATGARDGSGDLSGVDDYTASDNDILTAESPGVDLEWIDGSEATTGATSVSTSSGASVVIGEQVTYDILVNLPEGVTENLDVDNILPTGLQLDSYQVITAAGTGTNQSSLLTEAFSGSFAGYNSTTGFTAPPSGTTGTITFNFGNATVPSDNDTANNSFVIRITATVTNVVSNQQNVTLTDAAQVRFTNPNDGSTATVTDPTTGATDAGNNPVLTVQEPAVTITKTASSTSPDANDPEVFTITLANTSGQEAYDLTLADTINADITVGSGVLGVLTGSTVTLSSGAVVSAGAFQIVDNAGTYVLESTSGATIDLPTGESIQLTYTGTVANTVTPGQEIGDPAVVKWTSLPGTSAAERTGTDGVGGALNDYAAEAPGTLEVTPVEIVKSVVTTSLGGDDGLATIGEIITYELTVTLPEGVLSDLQIDDLLPDGMAYVSSAGITIGTTNFNGSTPTLASTTYTGDATNGGGGLDLEFNPITVTPDNVTTNNTFTITYQASVLDVTTNSGASGAQTVLTNSVTDNQGAGSVFVTAATTASVTVVEPNVALTSTLLPANSGATTADADDPVIYTLTADNSTGTSAAYDTALSNTLPTDVLTTNGDFTATIVNGTTSTNVSADFSLMGGALTTTTPFTLQVGDVLTITIDGTLSSATLPGENLATTANLTYTTYPGARTDVDGDGSTVTTDQERTTALSSTATLTVPSAIAITKALTASTDPDTTDPDLTIGEVGTYQIVTTLEQGTTPTLQITDTLAAGLTYDTGSDSVVAGVTYSSLAVSSSVTGGITTLVFTLTDVTVPVTTSVGTGSITLQYQATVADIATNVGLTGAQQTLTNSAYAKADYNGDGVYDATSATVSTTITLVEPHLTATSAITPATGTTADAGDPMTITNTLTNSGTSTAWDVVFTSSLDPNFDATALINAQTTNGNVDNLITENGVALTGWTATYDSTTRKITFTAGGTTGIAAGTSVAFSYGASLLSTVAPDTTLANILSVSQDYTLEGSLGRNEHGPTTTDYFVTTDALSVVKSLAASNDNDTTGSDVAIGEGTTYQLVVTLEQGVTKELVVTDILPIGLSYDSTFTPTVTGGTGLTEGGFTVTVTDNPSGTTTLTFTLTNVSIPVTTSVGTNTLTILYQAEVINTPTNLAKGLLGTTLTNTAYAQAAYDPNTDDTAFQATSATVSQTVTIVEPNLTITPTIAPTTGTTADAGDSMTVTNTLTNSGDAPSWDTVFTSTVDANLDDSALEAAQTADSNINSLVTVTENGTPVTGWTATYNSTTREITFSTTGEIAAGTLVGTAPNQTLTPTSIVFTYEAPLLATLAPQTILSVTSTVTQSNTIEGGGPNSRNENGSTASATFTTASHIDIAKTLYSSSDADTTDPDLTIGEVATYQLASNLEQGETASLTFTDTLASGLTYLGNVVVAGATYGSLAETSSGNTITFVLTDVIVTATGSQATGLVTLQYQAQVADVAGNVGLSGSQTTLANSATVTAKYHDSVTTSSGPSTESITVVEPQLSVTTDTVAPTSTTKADAGDSLTVTNTLENTGTSTAWDTVFTSSLDPNLDPTTLVIATVTGWTSAYDSGTGLITFTADNSTGGIAAGASVTFSYTATLKATTAPKSTITNAVAVTQEYSLPDEGGRSESSLPTDSATFTTASHIDVTKALVSTSDADTAGSNVTIGEVATYSLTSNLEEGETATLTFTDTLAAGLTYVANSESFSGATYGSFTESTSGNTVTFVLTDVTVAATGTTGTGAVVLQYNAQVADVAGNVGLTGSQTTLANSATVTANYHDSVSASASSNTVDVIVVEPKLTITTDTVAPTSGTAADAGDSMTVTNTLENTGTSTAWEVVFTSTLDANLDATTLAVTAPSGWSYAYDPGTGKITFTAGNTTGIASGGAVTFSYTASLLDTVAPRSVVANAVAVTQDYTLEGGTGRNEGGPTASDTFTTADSLAVAKSLVSTSDSDTSGSNLTIGEVGTYDLAVTLEQGATGTLVVTDTLAAGLTYIPGVSTTVSGATYSALTANAVTNGDGTTTVTFTLTGVEVPTTTSVGTGTVTLQYQASVANVAGNVGTGTQTTLTNSAYVTADYNSDGVVDATSSTVSTTVTVVEPKLTITTDTVAPTSTSAADAGDSMTVTNTLKNTGTSTAYDVVFTSSLDPNLDATTLAVTVPTGWTYAYNSGTGLITFTANDSTGSIAAGASVTFSYTATLKATTAPDTTVTNAVAVTQEDTLQQGETGRRSETSLPTDSATFTTASHIDVTKALVSTSDADTSGSNLTIGEVGTYSLTSNLEEGETATLTFTDTLAAGLTYNGNMSFSGATYGSFTESSSGNTVTFVLTDVVVAATGTTGTGAVVLQYDATVADAAGNVGLTGSQTTLANSATVTANYHDSVDATASSNTVSVTVVEPQLTITTDTVSPTSGSAADAGDSMTVTNTLKNTGTSTAWDTVFTSTLDPNLDATTLAVTAPTGWTYAYDSGTGLITFTADNSTGGIAAGASATFSYTATLKATTAPDSTITNAVAVTREYSLPGEAGRSETSLPTDSATFTTAAAVDVTKALVTTSDTNTTGSNLTIGEVATYSLTSNLEEGETASLTFTDTLASGLSYVANSASFSGATYGSLAVTSSGNTVTFVLTDVVVAATGTTGTGAVVLQYDAKVADVAGNVGLTGSQTTLANSATVTANYHDSVDATASSNTVSVTVVEPQITIGETVSTSSPHLGDTITYTVTLTNTGTSEAYDTELTLAEPSALTITGITGTALTGATTETAAALTGSGAGLTGTYDLAAGGTVVVTYTVQVSTDPSTIGGTYGAAGNTLNPTAQATWTSLPNLAGERTDASGAGGSPDDYITTTASPLATVTVVGSDVSLTKTDGATTVTPGETFTYTLTATNSGTAGATDVVIVDTLPSTEIFTSADDGGVYTGGTVIGGVSYGGTVTWTLTGTLAVNASSSVTVTVALPAVVAATTETVVNTATVTQSDVDPTPANNTATDTDTVDATPDLVVTKTASVPAANGTDPVTYTITVTNVGDQDASATVLTDPIDTVLATFISATGGGTDTANVVTWNLGTLAGGGGTTSVQVTVQIVAPLPPLVTTLTNTASATFNQTLSGNDPTPANNSASVTISVPDSPDMAVSVASSTDQVRLGDVFTYTLDVTDIGYRNATGVTVTDVIPVGVDFVSASDGGVYDAATRTITWTGAGTSALSGVFLGVGLEDVKLQVTVQLPTSSLLMGTIADVATVANDGTNGVDPRLSNNTATVNTEVFSFLADTFENFSLPGDGLLTQTFLDNTDPTLTVSDNAEDAADAVMARWMGPYYVPPEYRYVAPLISLMPLYSGSADPGSTLTIEIFSAGGAEVGTETVVADAGGNWVAGFPTTTLRDYPQTVTISSQAPVNGDADASGFNLRTYFSPAVNSSHFFRQQLDIGSIFAELPSTMVRDEYQAALHPINFNVTGHGYEFLSAQPTPAGY